MPKWICTKSSLKENPFFIHFPFHFSCTKWRMVMGALSGMFRRTIERGSFLIFPERNKCFWKMKNTEMKKEWTEFILFSIFYPPCVKYCVIQIYCLNVFEWNFSIFFSIFTHSISWEMNYLFISFSVLFFIFI